MRVKNFLRKTFFNNDTVLESITPVVLSEMDDLLDKWTGEVNQDGHAKVNMELDLFKLLVNINGRFLFGNRPFSSYDANPENEHAWKEMFSGLTIRIANPDAHEHYEKALSFFKRNVLAKAKRNSTPLIEALRQLQLSEAEFESNVALRLPRTKRHSA